MAKPVIVGNIGAPYGVQGWVKINSFTEPKDNLFSYKWLLGDNDSWQPIEVTQYRAHAGGFVAQLADIADRDKAALITNKKIAVMRDDMPVLDDDEYYWEDLIGLSVCNHENVSLGKVTDIFSTGANDVLVVKGDNGEHLIPLVINDYVIKIDFDALSMQVRWDPEF